MFSSKIVGCIYTQHSDQFAWFEIHEIIICLRKYTVGSIIIFLDNFVSFECTYAF